MRITDVRDHDASVEELRERITTRGDDVVIDLRDPAPGLAPLVEERVEIHQRLRWDTSDGGASWTAQVQVEVSGAPLTASAVLVLEPIGSGCRTTVSVDLACGLPVLGGRVLEAIRPVAEEHLGRVLDDLEAPSEV